LRRRHQERSFGGFRFSRRSDVLLNFLQEYPMKKWILPGAAMLVMASAPLALAQSMSSNEFLTTAIKGDLAEMKVGHLAETNGGSEAVRNFGKTLVTDHTKAGDQAKSVAKQANVDIPTQPSAEAQKNYEKLSKLKGKAFDREFATMMVADHDKDIRMYEQEAKAKSGPASDLAEKQLPTLRKHLQMAKSIEQEQQAKAP
jgi:putative membrane protein